METHDFKCRLCATRWLKYTENNIPCSSSLHEDKRHNFDFSKPIKVEPQENVISTARSARRESQFSMNCEKQSSNSYTNFDSSFILVFYFTA